jgi:hypothetical protein
VDTNTNLEGTGGASCADLPDVDPFFDSPSDPWDELPTDPDYPYD